MNVALVLPEFDPARGGAENWTFQFARRLIADGHRVHLVAERFGRDAGELEIIRHRVDVRRRWRKDYLAFAAAAERSIDRLEVDVVHDMGHGWAFDVLQPHGGTRGGSFRQNLATAPRGTRWLKRVAQRALPRYRALGELARWQFAARAAGSASNLPRYIALSRMVRRDMLRYHSVRDDQIDVVYNGVDVGRFSPEVCGPLRWKTRSELGANDTDVLLLLVAHNFRLKGVDTAVRAVGRLVKAGRPLRLVVLGRDRAAGYQRIASRLGCEMRVSFHAAVADPLPYYAAADVYVHPTLYDPCSLVVLEALACGLPVVTTVHNGAGELLTRGRDGFVLSDAKDDKELSGLIEHLLDPRRRRAMSEAARQTALEHSLERNYREVLAVYEGVIWAKRKSAAVHRPAFAAAPRPIATSSR